MTRWGFTPTPANPVPSGASWRVTENCPPKLFGSAKVATSPGLRPVGSRMMGPRPAARNAASKSSAGPAVALDTSAAIGPPYEGRSALGATVSASGPYHVVAESPRFHARNTARYWGVLQRTAENGRSVRRARIWLAYSVLPSVARRRSNTSPCTRVKSGNARSNWRTTSSSPREAIRTTAMPPGSDSVANAGGAGGPRSFSARLPGTLRTPGPPPRPRGRDHCGPPVAEQGDEAPQPAVEQQIRLRLGRELQVGDEPRVPIGPHAVPVREVVAGLRPHRGDRRRALGGGELLRGDRALGGRRDRRYGQTREEPRRSVFHAPNLSPSLPGTAGAHLPLPARAPSRPHAAPPGAPRARRADRGLHRVQPPMAGRGPACAVRRQPVGRGPHPVHGPVDRVAAVGMDLLRPRDRLSPGQGCGLGERGARSGTLPCKAGHGASGGTAPCSRPPALSSPLPRPRDLCLRRCRRRAVNLRRLERLSPSSGNPSLARISRSPTRARRPQAASPLRSARRHAPRRGRDAGDRGAGERAPARSDRADGRHDRHLPLLHPALRARVPRALGAARCGDGAR